MSHQIEIETKTPTCRVEFEETVTGKSLLTVWASFIPAPGDEVEIKRRVPHANRAYADTNRAYADHDVYETVRVLRRSWDMSNDEGQTATLIVERIQP